MLEPGEHAGMSHFSEEKGDIVVRLTELFSHMPLALPETSYAVSHNTLGLEHRQPAIHAALVARHTKRFALAANLYFALGIGASWHPQTQGEGAERYKTTLVDQPMPFGYIELVRMVAEAGEDRLVRPAGVPTPYHSIFDHLLVASEEIGSTRRAADLVHNLHRLAILKRVIFQDGIADRPPEDYEFIREFEREVRLGAVLLFQQSVMPYIKRGKHLPPEAYDYELATAFTEDTVWETEAIMHATGDPKDLKLRLESFGLDDTFYSWCSRENKWLRTGIN